MLELPELGSQGSFEALHVGAETRGSLKGQFVFFTTEPIFQPRHDSLKKYFHPLVEFLSGLAWRQKKHHTARFMMAGRERVVLLRVGLFRRSVL